ncbi:MAG TPA: hypothetical protein VG146_01650 [Verrucomicrobiae bacterium]|nr:hypothetical protein [Verrucomicrobiae bacterium]
MSFTITNAADVARISRSVHLEADPVGRRWDLHSHDAIFRTPAGKIEVQFCNECLDVVIDSQGSIAHYKMPKGFYKEVWNEIQKRPQKERWAMEPP